MGKFSLPRVATMRHQVDLAEPRTAHLPTVRLHWNVVLQQRTRLGTSINPPFPLALLRWQAPVDLPSTDAQQLFLQRRAYPVALTNPREPTRQQGLQPHRPGISRSFPDRRQNRKHLRALAPSPSTPPSLRLLPRRRASEVESHISGGSRGSGKIRSTSPASLPAPPCDTAHTPPG